ncbi:MAG TPA: alpha-amylase family glycosyl hydrolase [Candidatus Dormibacteraeota bacterium]|nr:alpha-amylase family glycosyl hydrolase [Candidatus Dormibacteraeota bacterium]
MDLTDSSQTDWWQRGVVYQIYPRSFADSDGDGLGDVAGIEAHLDHLRDGTAGSLGVDAIWLSPIYPSPDFDMGYDVADYVGVDPRYGTIAGFERLVAACHARGLRVILDLVLNHSSSRHAWFTASRAGREGPYADWYIWRDSPGRTRTGGRRLPNNWRSFFGGPAWTWEPAREQFYLHTFLPEQPDLNWRSPAVRAALLDVVRTWLDRGVDGFRLDVFNTYFKDAQLRSNPRTLGGRGAWSWQRHVHDRDQPELQGALAELRSLVDEHPGRMTVGELFDGRLGEAAGYIAPRHLIFDWSLVGLPWSASAFAGAIAARDAAFGPERWPANVLSNHDQPRHASRYDDGRSGDARAKVAATLLATLRGTPFLYYGEEIAQRNLVVPKAEAIDPPARRASFLFPWWNRDQGRGPMAWRPGPGGGFTTGTPWLPLAPDIATHNVATEAADPGSVLSWYRKVLALRRATPALQIAAQELVDVGDRDVLAYVRGAGVEATFVALSFADRPATIRLPTRAAAATGWTVALSTHGREGLGALPTELALEPNEALIARGG